LKKTVALELVSGWFAGAWSVFEYIYPGLPTPLK